MRGSVARKALSCTPAGLPVYCNLLPRPCQPPSPHPSSGIAPPPALQSNALPRPRLARHGGAAAAPPCTPRFSVRCADDPR